MYTAPAPVRIVHIRCIHPWRYCFRAAMAAIMFAAACGALVSNWSSPLQMRIFPGFVIVLFGGGAVVAAAVFAATLRELRIRLWLREADVEEDEAPRVLRVATRRLRALRREILPEIDGIASENGWGDGPVLAIVGEPAELPPPADDCFLEPELIGTAGSLTTHFWAMVGVVFVPVVPISYFWPYLFYFSRIPPVCWLVGLVAAGLAWHLFRVRSVGLRLLPGRLQVIRAPVLFGRKRVTDFEMGPGMRAVLFAVPPCNHIELLLADRNKRCKVVVNKKDLRAIYRAATSRITIPLGLLDEDIPS